MTELTLPQPEQTILPNCESSLQSWEQHPSSSFATILAVMALLLVLTLVLEEAHRPRSHLQAPVVEAVSSEQVHRHHTRQQGSVEEAVK